MPILNLITTFIALVGNVFLALFTLYKNPKSLTNKLFFLFTLSISIYIVINFLSLNQTSDEATFFWVKMILSVAVFINLLFFLLVITFPQPKLQLKKFYLLITLVITLFLLVPIHTNLIFTEVKLTPTGTSSTPGPAMPFFLLHTLVFLGGGFTVLIKKLRRSNGIEKNQLKLFLLGTITMFISILVTNLLLVLILNTTAFIGLLPLYTLIFISFVSYAIVKHRFLDIQLLVARAVAYTVFILAIGGFYSISIFLVGSTAFSIPFTNDQLLFFGVITLLVAFTFQPLRRSIERITDRFFYKDRYETSKLLYDLALIMASTLRLGDLLHHLLKTLLSQMRISRGAFILTGKEQIYQVVHEGYANTPEFDEKKTLRLLSENKMLVFEELPENEIKEILRSLDFTLVLYLKVKSGHIGLLALGEKLSGDIYNSEDIRLLEIFAPEAAVAIQNAIAYEEIRRFNRTLQEKVDLATKDLQEANERLEALDKLKDEFISITSHELRTPMTAIKSYLWMVIHKGQTLSDEKKKLYLDRVYVSTERLIALVNDMLNVSRIESGRITITPEFFSIADLAKEVAEELRPKANERHIFLTIEDANVQKVYADRNKIREVLTNLIGNALKFTSAQGAVSLSFKEKDHFVEVCVIDTGKGIKKENFPKLFKKFGRLEHTLVSVAESEGTGLGLYICKQFVELSGGSIWATSEVGKGSTFTFSLPTYDISN